MTQPNWLKNKIWVPEGLSYHVVSSKKAQANWYRKLLDAWREAKPPPKTPEEASSLVIQTLKRHQKADVKGLLAYYGLPQQSSASATTSLPQGVKFELQTLPVDTKAVPDGDTITVYVSTTDPRESLNVPRDVQSAADQRSRARAAKNYTKADELHKKIIDSGYRVLNLQNQEILARKYRIRLRGIDAPESSMPYGKEAKEELVKLVQGKCLRVLVYDEDQYGRCVGDIYCNGKFVQEVMLKKGLAWHYSAYDQRVELATVLFSLSTYQPLKDSRRVLAHIGAYRGRGKNRLERRELVYGLTSNPEKPWEWRKDKRQGR
ncbi:hypothetical protein GOBAR_AA18973 [Gossypium barbadense]|uniref:TNase-like domain-containing protein n=1 Tax=Gossypium barbadense TaxID=3634 RepID=A0A2P5XEE5_GOSBA|nr:hypothetical protein GOBAR_AA18973 [Gossypium barbadense]